MTSPRFEAALAFTLGQEGGLSNHKRDRGGLTNRGVTQKRYTQWRRAQGLKPRSVRRIEENELRAIALEYWREIRGDTLPPGLDMAAFDAAFLAGGDDARRWLGQTRDLRTFLGLYRDFMRSRPDADAFGRGWQTRLDDLENSAMAAAGIAEKPKTMKSAIPKTASVPPWLASARRDHGEREIKGKRHNPRILAYWAAIGQEIAEDETAWCAAFVGAHLEWTGWASTRSTMARSYAGWGRKLDGPRLGAIAVFPRGKPPFGHVAFVDEIDGDHVSILGGNQRDAVTRQRFKISDAIGFFWPVSQVQPSDRIDEAPRWRPSATPSTSEDVKRVQSRLRALGYRPGEIDGEAGENTADAVAAFQRRHNLKGERGAWYPSYDAILDAAPSIVPEKRKETRPEDLERGGDWMSRLYRLFRNLMAWLAGLLGIGSVTTASLPEALTQTQTALAPIAAVVSWAQSNGWLILIVACIAAAVVAHYTRERRAHAYRHFDWQGPYKEVK